VANRRQFLSTGIAVSGLAALPYHRVLAHPALPAAHASLVIADRTLSESTAFLAAATQVRDDSTIIRAFAGDLAGVWLRDIEPRLRGGAALTLTGLTGAGVLFCIETLGRNYGLGIVYRAEHDLATLREDWAARTARETSAAAEELFDSPFLPAFEHVVRPGATEPALITWVAVREARRRRGCLTTHDAGAFERAAAKTNQLG
jgi:hypothetical protein